MKKAEDNQTKGEKIPRRDKQAKMNDEFKDQSNQKQGIETNDKDSMRSKRQKYNSTRQMIVGEQEVD